MSGSEKKIQKIMMRNLLDKNHIMVLPNNKSVYNWEADLLSLTSSGLFHEYEIKTNLRDYERDFSGSTKKETKHRVLNTTTIHKPNRFWFVVEGFQVSWLPHYAGLIEISGGVPHILTKAPLLHNHPASMPQLKRSLRSISFRLLKHYYM